MVKENLVDFALPGVQVPVIQARPVLLKPHKKMCLRKVLSYLLSLVCRF